MSRIELCKETSLILEHYMVFHTAHKCSTIHAQGGCIDRTEESFIEERSEKDSGSKAIRPPGYSVRVSRY